MYLTIVSDECASLLQRTRIPGDMCRKCRNNRKTCIRRMRPLIDISDNLFEDYLGRRYGLASCVVNSMNVFIGHLLLING